MKDLNPFLPINLHFHGPFLNKFPWKFSGYKLRAINILTVHRIITLSIDFIKKNYISDHISLNVSCVSRIYWKFIACEKFSQPFLFPNAIFYASMLIGYGRFYANIEIGVKKILIMRHVNFCNKLRHLQPFRFVTIMTMSLFALRLMLNATLIYGYLSNLTCMKFLNISLIRRVHSDNVESLLILILN